MSSVAGPWVRTSEDAIRPWAIRLAAIELGLRNRGEEHTPEVGAQVLKELSDKDISHGWTRQHQPEKCAPPIRDPNRFDRQMRWEEFQQDRYEKFLDATGPVIWRDPAGAGKTTNAARSADARNRKHAVLFDKHEKAREFIDDENTPDDYLHLKGPDQPRNDCCLDAKIKADENEIANCSDHGPESEWDRMCPLFERDESHPLRQRFDALSKISSRQEAHKEFCGGCPWSAQFDDLADKQRIAGVHEHQQLVADLNHDVLLDETPRILSVVEQWSTNDLRRAGTLLTLLGEEGVDHAQTLGEFVRNDLLDAVLDGNLDDLTPPDIGSYSIAEKLAQLKVAYCELLKQYIDLGIWDSTPVNFDVILATFAELGLSSDACREAIAGPSTLDTCPHCQVSVSYFQGSRSCPNCYWEEDRFSILAHDDRQRARAIASLRTKDDPNVSENRLCYAKLTHPSDLPEKPLVLDATATPAKVAGYYGVPLDEVVIDGDESLELNATIRQIRDGAYHQGTIKDAFKDDKRQLDDRLQQAIDTIAAQHDKPLFIATRDLLHRFDFSSHAETRHYWGLRGLNMDECDAVVCIGGPHPNIRGLEQKARLLAMDHPDLEVGGDEHSRREAAPNPPIYRKLFYEDDHGRGRAVPTKHYTGLFGDLFREGREKELEQAVHRIRPLLADASKDVYLLTSVPTSLPIDHLVSLDDFTDEPLAARLPVSDDVIPHLLEPLNEIINGDSQPDITGIDVTDGTLSATRSGLHTVAQNSGAEWSKTTLWRRINALLELGLFTKGEYEQDQGYRYTVNRAAISRALLISSGTCGKAELVKRLREKTSEAHGSLDWLDWAYDKFISSNS